MSFKLRNLCNPTLGVVWRFIDFYDSVNLLRKNYRVGDASSFRTIDTFGCAV